MFLHGESPWTEEPGRLRSMGSQRARHNWATKHTRTSLLSTVMGFISMGTHFAKISISHSSVLENGKFESLKIYFWWKLKPKTALLKKMKRKCGLVLLDNSVRTCWSLPKELKFTSFILSWDYGVVCMLNTKQYSKIVEGSL